MNSSKIETGRRAEEIAARFLEGQGYRITRRNYRCAVGEIDLIAEEDGEVVFVEVRSRQAAALVRAEETITRAKANRLVRLGQYYLSESGSDQTPWRIDVIAVEFDGKAGSARIDWFQDATSDLAER